MSAKTGDKINARQCKRSECRLVACSPPHAELPGLPPTRPNNPLSCRGRGRRHHAARVASPRPRSAVADGSANSITESPPHLPVAETGGEAHEFAPVEVAEAARSTGHASGSAVRRRRGRSRSHSRRRPNRSPTVPESSGRSGNGLVQLRDLRAGQSERQSPSRSLTHHSAPFASARKPRKIRCRGARPQAARNPTNSAGVAGSCTTRNSPFDIVGSASPNTQFTRPWRLNDFYSSVPDRRRGSKRNDGFGLLRVIRSRKPRGARTDIAEAVLLARRGVRRCDNAGSLGPDHLASPRQLGSGETLLSGYAACRLAHTAVALRPNGSPLPEEPPTRRSASSLEVRGAAPCIQSVPAWVSERNHALNSDQ